MTSRGISSMLLPTTYEASVFVSDKSSSLQRRRFYGRSLRMQKHQMLIGGSWVDPASNAWLESINPYTASPWALVPRGTKDDVERAVAAAKSAFYGDWRKLTASARGALLRKFGDLVAHEAPRLAEIETTDNGKLLAEMRGQTNYIP